MNDTAILWKQYRAFVQGSISPRRLETAERVWLGIARSEGSWWCYPSIAILDHQLKASHIENDMDAGGDWYVHRLSCIELDEVILKIKLFLHAAEQIKAGYKD